MKAGVDFTGITTPFYCNDGQGKLLLHKRSANCRDEHGTWDPGGGRLEFGQSLEESVLREVLEEYGCAGEIQDMLPTHSLSREWKGKKTHWLIIPFFVLVKPTEAKINEPDKIDEIGWFTLDDLPEPLHTGFQYTYSEHQKYFAKVINQ